MKAALVVVIAAGFVLQLWVENVAVGALLMLTSIGAAVVLGMILENEHPSPRREDVDLTPEPGRLIP